jgi:hypothetical protein
MTSGTGARLPVALGGGVAGVVLEGDGALEVLDDAVRIEAPPEEVIVAMSGLEGVGFRDGRLTLYLHHGDIIEASGSARLAAVSREIISQVCTLPELTRPLRGLGSRRGQPGSEHDRFFAPLLLARRKGERASDSRGRLRAFDAAGLETALDQTISELARSRHPKRSPERRALEAELLELAVPLRAAIDALHAASRGALAEDAPPETMFLRWRSWCRAVEVVFAQADRAWLSFVRVVGPPPPSRRPIWRRLLRLGSIVA